MLSIASPIYFSTLYAGIITDTRGAFFCIIRPLSLQHQKHITGQSRGPIWAKLYVIKCKTKLCFFQQVFMQY